MPESNEKSKFVSHRTRMSWEFDSRKHSYPTKFNQRPRILVKLSLTELCYSKLSGLRDFDNMTISMSQKTDKNRRGRP